MHPQPFGDSSCAVSIPQDEAREPFAVLDRLLRALNYRGVFSAEFKYDERDNAFKLIEINPRAWGGLSLAVSCGVNVIEMAYRDALGIAVTPVLDYPIGRRWFFGARDARVCWGLLRAGRLTTRDWIGSWYGAVEPIIQLDDPGPGMRASPSVVSTGPAPGHSRRAAGASSRTAVTASSPAEIGRSRKMVRSPANIWSDWRNDRSSMRPRIIASTSAAAGKPPFLSRKPRAPNAVTTATSNAEFLMLYAPAAHVITTRTARYW
jgi:hypothetical protein